MQDRFAKQLSNALLSEFNGKIFLDDTQRSDRDQQFHTRALSAMVVRYLTDCPAKRAADFVTDGADDHDIDAVAYDERQNKIWFIQTKWSKDGRAKLREKDVKTFTVGMGYMLKGEFQRFNQRFRPHEVAIESLLDNDPQVCFVFALATPDDLHTRHRAILDECAAEVGKWYRKSASIEILTLDKLVKIARAGMGEPPIDLEVRFAQVQSDDVPHRVFFGTVTAEEVARWYREFGERLFRRNIRGALGRTSVNEAIRTTLIESPEHFWDYNNGITMVARSGSVGLTRSGNLKDVAIVNGAQTVSSIADTVKEYPQAGNAKVLVKISVTGETGDDLIREITGAANTQNRVEIRDLASLYGQQDDLKMEFKARLGLEYTTRHTEAAPDEKDGCTSEEALIALACGHADHRYTVQAKTLPDVLWDRSGNGAYRNLFRSGITADEVWRHVRLMRSVKGGIATARKKFQGRAAQIADHGDLFTVHLIARQLTDRLYADDWDDAVLPEAAASSGSTLKRVVAAVDGHFKTHPSSLFKDEQKTREIEAFVAAQIDASATVPPLPDDYVKGRAARRSRTPNLVPLIAKQRAIEDGTLLEFRPITREQRQLFGRWNTENPSRSRATWVNAGGGQLRWEVDGKTYAASRLALELINSLGDKRYKSVRGPECWHIPGLGSLKDIGMRLREGLEDPEEDEESETGLF
ncbi:AIPR family protein [Glycomyces buryatensis]|uniref:AIPR family protein n=1 Tax=Glycomyces buryatensis TaxID=2570927 RepID=UPI00145627C6|nr:AIPR family protein [Glycomyces buryatensis]